MSDITDKSIYSSKGIDSWTEAKIYRLLNSIFPNLSTFGWKQSV